MTIFILMVADEHWLNDKIRFLEWATAAVSVKIVWSSAGLMIMILADPVSATSSIFSDELKAKWITTFYILYLIFVSLEKYLQYLKDFFGIFNI